MRPQVGLHLDDAGDPPGAAHDVDQELPEEVPGDEVGRSVVEGTWQPLHGPLDRDPRPDSQREPRRTVHGFQMTGGLVATMVRP